MKKKKTYNLQKLNIDEEKFKKKIIQNEIISFDLYDTLVRRKCSKPDEIYSLLGEYADLKFKIKNFQFIRMNVGNKMEIRKGQIYNLDQIYSQIFIDYKINIKCLTVLKKYEEKLELQLSNLVTFYLKHLEFAKNKKKK